MLKFIKKFLKLIFITVVVLVILLVIAIGVALYYLDTLLKKGIERGGALALGVPTQVDVAHLGLMAGELSLKKLKIQNPPGFTGADFMTIGDMGAAVTLGSLNHSTVEVPYLKLSDVYVSLEKKGDKQNYQVILDNLESFQERFNKGKEKAGNTGAPTAQTSSSGKRFVIREIEIKNVQVDARVETLGGVLGSRTIHIVIPQIKVKDVGNDRDNGMAIEEVTGVVTAAVLKAVVEQGGGLLPPEISGGLKTGLGALGDIGGVSVEVIGTVSKGVLDTAGKTIEGISKGIGGLLEGDKKKDEGKTQK